MAKIIKGSFPRSQKDDNREKKLTPIYQFSISLTYSDPPIWRRFQVPGDFRLSQMHEVIGVLLGWSGEEAHQFYVGKIFYGMASKGNGVGAENRFDEEKYTLQDIEESMKWCFLYLYDAGEGWEHEIELEEILDFSDGESYPQVLSGERSGPSEDFDGIHEYEQYVTGLSDVPYPEDAENIRPGSDGFDPYFFDMEAMNKALKKMSKFERS